jgi:hypothetical protein
MDFIYTGMHRCISTKKHMSNGYIMGCIRASVWDVLEYELWYVRCACVGWVVVCELWMD